MNRLRTIRSRRSLSLGPPADDRAGRIILAGLLATTALVALQAVSQAIDFGVFSLRIWALNSDKHYSLFGLASLFAQLTFAAACLWRGRRLARDRRMWFVLGALVAVLLLVRGLITFNAVAFAVPLACVLGLLCWLTRHDAAAPRVAVWGGLVLMGTSLVLHKVGLAADSNAAAGYTWAYQIEAMVKHGAELAGWMLVTIGTAAGVVDHTATEVIPAGIPVGSHAAFPRPVRASSRRLARRNEA
jgi:hypothetical protein